MFIMSCAMHRSDQEVERVSDLLLSDLVDHQLFIHGSLKLNSRQVINIKEVCIKCDFKRAIGKIKPNYGSMIY